MEISHHFLDRHLSHVGSRSLLSQKKSGTFVISFSIPSTYGVFTYIYHKHQPNVGKYAIHGWYGFLFLRLTIQYHLLPSNFASTTSPNSNPPHQKNPSSENLLLLKRHCTKSFTIGKGRTSRFVTVKRGTRSNAWMPSSCWSGFGCEDSVA